MQGAIHSVLLVGIGGLAAELSRELAARGIPTRETTLMQLSREEDTRALLVLGPAAARAARLDVVKRFQTADRPVVVLSQAEAAADLLRSLSAGRVAHVPPAGSVVQLATAIVRAVAPDWEATETVRPPPAALPPEVMAEMTGNSPRSEPPEELDSALLESVHPGAPPPAKPPPFAAPARPPAAEESPAPEPPAPSPADASPASETSPSPARDWPEREVAKPRTKRSVAPLVWGAAALGAVGLIAIVVVVVILSSGDDTAVREATPSSPVVQEEARAEAPLAPSGVTATGPSALVRPPAEAIDAGAPPERAPAEAPAASGASPVPGASPDELLAAARAATSPRDPRESDALSARAHHAISTGDHATAREQLDRALALDPDNPRAWAELGRVELATGDAAAAVRWLELAVEARGRRAEYHLWLGDARRAAGDDAGARRAWESALRRDPDNDDARARLR